MNKVENTLLEKRDKEHYGNLVVERHEKRFAVDKKYIPNTPVVTRCIRNDMDQLR